MSNTTTSLDTPRYDGEVIAYPILAAHKIPKGILAFVTISDGYVDPDVADPSGSIRFVGVTAEEVAAPVASGGAKVECYQTGAFEFAMSGAAITDIGAAAYVSDNQTVKTTANGAVKVGTIVKYENASKVFVDIARGR